MKGEILLVNGDNWMVVDVAPAGPLAEMVAVMLQEGGFVVMTKAADNMADIMSSLGAHYPDTTLVLVPEERGEDALKLIADTVTDYEGEELEALMDEMSESDKPLDV